MKSAEKWYLIVIFVCIGIFLLLRIYHVLDKNMLETKTFMIKGRVPELRVDESSLRLLMVGDALIHDGVYKDGYQSDGSYSFLHQLELVKPIVQSYDLAYYNQETILGGSEIGLSTYPRFNSPYEIGDAFVDAGFNLVSTANNHTLDRGKEGIMNSLSYWRRQENVLMSGTCDSFDCVNEIPVGEKNKITYAFLSYTTSTNGLTVSNGEEYLVRVYSEELAKKDILKAKEIADVLIVSMHWGREYHDIPSDEQRSIAHFLADLGVHIIIGNHPHVIQPIEWIKDTLVFYSLGNFISAQTGIDKLIGLMAGVKITKKESGEEKEILIEDIQTNLVFTSYNSKFRNFKVYPFEQINSSILVNKEEIYEKKKALVTSLGVSVSWNT